MEKIYFSHILLFFCGALSVYNFINSWEKDSQLAEVKKNFEDSVSNSRSRQRRDLNNDGDDIWQDILDINKLDDFVKQKANETFQAEINEVLTKLILNFPVKSLCENISVKCRKEKCKQQQNLPGKKVVTRSTGSKAGSSDSSSVVCLPGPQGPPGPRGPPGKRGLGLEKPKLINSSSITTVNETADVTFQCTFFGNPIPNVQWVTHAHKTRILEVIDNENALITSKLVVSNVNWSDKGLYKCNANSLLGSDHSTVRLNVLASPQISMAKGPVFVNKGVNFQFPECKVRAFPEASIKWKRFFWSFPVGRYSTYDGFLNISRIRYEDEGFYICEAENYFGKTSQRLQVKVKGLEMHDRPPPKIKAVGAVNITCSAYGNPVEISGKIEKTETREEVTSHTIQLENILILKAEVNESGTYRCMIKSKTEQVQAYTTVDLFSMDSSILNSSSEEMNLLGTWLQEFSAFGVYKRCYYSRNDKSYFHNRCNGKSQTITIARTSGDGKIYGGYTDAAWTSPRYSGRTHISSSTNTFIFNMDTRTKYNAKKGSSTTVCYSSYGPCFGNKEFYISCCSAGIYWGTSSISAFADLGTSQRNQYATVEVFYRV